MSNIQTTLNWMTSRQGRVTYSMAYRNGPNSYDCSSAVFYALQAGGFTIPFIGNTETLFSMRGGLLSPISRSDVRAGDIFVSGIPGGSSNAYGHTGFALNATQAIHCSSTFNGIGISSNADSSVRAYAGAPVYWFRVAGSSAPSPTPPDNPDEDSIMITDINDGVEYIEQPQLVQLFGKRFETVQFDDVDSAEDLLQKAQDYLVNQPLELQELRLTFAQLQHYNINYKELRKGDVIHVRINDLHIDQRMRIEDYTVDLSDGDQGDVILGKQFKTLTSWIANPKTLVKFNQ